DELALFEGAPAATIAHFGNVRLSLRLTRLKEPPSFPVHLAPRDRLDLAPISARTGAVRRIATFAHHALEAPLFGHAQRPAPSIHRLDAAATDRASQSRGWAVSLPCIRTIAPGARLGQQTGRKRRLALGRLLVLRPSAAAARFSAFSHCSSYFHLLLDATGRRASAKLLPQSRHQSM